MQTKKVSINSKVYEINSDDIIAYKLKEIAFIRPVDDLYLKENGDLRKLFYDEYMELKGDEEFFSIPPDKP